VDLDVRGPFGPGGGDILRGDELAVLLHLCAIVRSARSLSLIGAVAGSRFTWSTTGMPPSSWSAAKLPWDA